MSWTGILHRAGLRLFRAALRLYPPAFRRDFAEEMTEVFRRRAAEAAGEGRLPAFLAREIAGLAEGYLWALRSQGERRLAYSGAGGGGPAARPDGWRPALLAGLPHLLLGLVTAIPMLLSAANPAWGLPANRLAPLGAAAIGLSVAAVLAYNLRRGWQRWSAGWAIYLALLPAVLLVYALEASGLADRWQPWSQTIFWFVITMLVMVVLYKIASRDRVRGLLAAVPVAAAPWTVFQEFVPDLLRGLAWAWIWLLAFAASAAILRVKGRGAAVALALAAPVLGGLPFAYLGVYHGGTLPFSQPGPSLLEVLRQYLPFLALTGAAVLGPQLAARLRALGRESAAQGGVAYARLALGGLLLALAQSAAQWGLSLGVPYRDWGLVKILWQGLPAGAAVLYLAGLALLVRAALNSGAFSGDDQAPLKMAVLAVALPGVPLVLAASLPGDVSFSPDWSLLQPAMLAWLLVSAWLASTRE